MKFPRIRRILEDRILRLALALLLVLLIGTAGYQAIEGWNAFDALYMTVITIASVGFMEVHALSPSGRLFTMLLILGGGGVLVYSFSVITAFLVEGELTDALRKRKMHKRIEDLRGHYIVCGADQTARYLIDELENTRQQYVVIERDEEKVKALEQQGILHVQGDATHDDTLQAAGIRRARGLIAALHSDADNLFVTLTAKGLNPSLRVISKALEEGSEQKLKRAGADGVVMPLRNGAMRMVSELIRPSVVTFLDLMLRSADGTIRVGHIEVPQGSRFVGKTIHETGVLDVAGMSVVALQPQGEEDYRFNPPKNTVLNAEDVLIVMGKVELIQRTQKAFGQQRVG